MRSFRRHVALSVGDLQIAKVASVTTHELWLDDDRRRVVLQVFDVGHDATPNRLSVSQSFKIIEFDDLSPSQIHVPAIDQMECRSEGRGTVRMDERREHAYSLVEIILRNANRTPGSIPHLDINGEGYAPLAAICVACIQDAVLKSSRLEAVLAASGEQQQHR